MIDCIVEDAKIRDYLLNLDHALGAPKAKFFLAGGFSRDEPASFVAALRRHYLGNLQTRTADRFGGVRVTVDAPMAVPDGRVPKVRTIWEIAAGQTVARLLTAYPLD